MGDAWPILLIVGTIVVVVAIFYFSYRWAKQRTEALQAIAVQFGFRFQPLGDEQLFAQLNGFHLFSQGRSKKIRNLMQGATHDLEVSFFDYQYTTGSGKNSHTWRQTVIWFAIPDPPLPTFSLRPEGFWHKIGEWFGYRDIDFDTHPTFSKKYLLRGEDEAAIRERFTEQILDWFQEHLNRSTEGSGNYLLHYRHSKRLKPEEIRQWMEEGFEVLGLFQHDQPLTLRDIDPDSMSV